MKTLTKDNHESILEELKKAGIDFDELSRSKTSHIVGTLGGKWYTDPNDDFMNHWTCNENVLIKLNSFTFLRHEKCWKVCGYVPLDISEEIFRSFRRDIKARDFYFFKPCTIWKQPLALMIEKFRRSTPHKNIACYKVKCDSENRNVVRWHHIYTQEALNYFVEVLKKYNLVKNN